jgi:hypothetical protein
VGLYEKQTPYNGATTPTVERHFIPGGNETAAIYTKTTPSGGTAAVSTSYLHHDHLGSTEAVTNETGQLVERFSYDAWGKRRRTDWSAADPGELLTWTATPYGSPIT